jgi:O-antigen ligase
MDAHMHIAAQPNTPVDPKVVGLCGLLWAASFLLPWGMPPFTAFAQLCSAVLVWGIAMTGFSAARQQAVGAPLWAALGVVGVLAVAAALQQRWVGVACLGAAAACVAFGARAADGARWATVLLWAFVAAAAISVLFGAVQVFQPAWTDNRWIAPIYTAGRAAGNLRQPNQLAMLLMLGVVAGMVLSAPRGDNKRTTTPGPWLLAAWLGAGIALTGSRTGLLGLAAIALWCLADRGLARAVRWHGAAALAGCLLAMAAMWWAQQMGVGTFHLENQIQSGGDLTSSRLGVLANALQMMADHPWTGVGWGNFNFVWTLTPFANRSGAFFDHTHNLLLNLLVELGIPLALLVMGAMVWVLWASRRAWMHPDAQSRMLARGTLMMLVLLGLHSMLEYPLWYSYFLLPAAFLLGLFIRFGAEARGPSDTMHALVSKWPTLALKTAGVAIVFGSLYAAWDYSRVWQIYTPFAQGLRKPLEQRIAEARHSVLFGHYADYGAITGTDKPEQAFDAFRRPMRFLIETRVMVAYAKALYARGEVNKARYVAQRLLEFRHSHPESKQFFAPCEVQPAPTPLPFQCDLKTPVTNLSYRDFL